MSSKPSANCQQSKYVLITAARNEEKYIERSIASVINQIVLPQKWVIVSDGSTDRTDKIVSSYKKQYNFIKLIRREQHERGQGFASKVQAIHKGVSQLKQTEYDFIGHLDADISMEKTYYSLILDKFKDNAKLGIAGGFIFENIEGTFKSRPLNVRWSVAGGIQLFRRICYNDINGLSPLELGGEDWHAETMARMKGWEVEAFPEIPAYHHKPSAGKRGFIKECIREGGMDFALGTHPLFEVIKNMRRIRQKPYFVYAAIRAVGFILPYLRRQQRPVSKEFVVFLRRTQIERLKALFLI